MKFHVDFDVVLREILFRDPNAYIILLFSEQQAGWKEKLIFRFQTTINSPKVFTPILKNDWVLVAIGLYAYIILRKAIASRFHRSFTRGRCRIGSLSIRRWCNNLGCILGQFVGSLIKILSKI